MVLFYFIFQRKGEKNYEVHQKQIFKGRWKCIIGCKNLTQRTGG